MNHDTNKVVALFMILGGIMAGAAVANSPPDLPMLWLLKAAATALPAMSAAFLRFETSNTDVTAGVADEVVQGRKDASSQPVHDITPVHVSNNVPALSAPKEEPQLKVS